MTSAGSSDPRAATFASTLAAAQVGAQWAFATLWVEYAPAVTAFLRARGAREPEDLASETFIAVLDRLSTFAGGEPEFRSFVFSIAYRRLVDEFRTRSRRPENVEWSAETDRRQSESAEQEALEGMANDSALALINSLPNDQRNVLTLRIIADLSIDQIAEVLDKRPGAVKALQRRGLDRLRKNFPPSRTPSGRPDDSKE